MQSYEKEYLNHAIECINKVIDERGSIPIKPIGEYTVDDIVKMRTGYSLIKGELEETKKILGLEE